MKTEPNLHHVRWDRSRVFGHVTQRRSTNAAFSICPSFYQWSRDIALRNRHRRRFNSSHRGTGRLRGATSRFATPPTSPSRFAGLSLFPEAPRAIKPGRWWTGVRGQSGQVGTGASRPGGPQERPARVPGFRLSCSMRCSSVSHPDNSISSDSEMFGANLSSLKRGGSLVFNRVTFAKSYLFGAPCRRSVRRNTAEASP